MVVNTTRNDAPNLKTIARVVGLDNREMFSRTDSVLAKANQTTLLPPLPLDALFASRAMLLVQLKLVDASGATVSDNFYWRGRDAASYRALVGLPQVPLEVTTHVQAADGEREITATLSNHGKAPALNAKLTLVDDRGERILPAYFSDNYLSMLPGETKTVTIRYPLASSDTPSLRLGGWNVANALIQVTRQ